MKASNVSSRNYFPLVERALSALQNWQAMVSRKHAGSHSTTCGSLQCLHLPSAPFLQIQSGQDKLCALPSALFPPVKILGVFSWEGTKDWNHPAGLLEHVADVRTLSTCTFGPWKDCACQDWGTHQLLAGAFWAEDMAGSAHSRKYWK